MGPVLQVLEPDQHVHLGSAPAGGGGGGGVAVGGDPPEDLGHGLGLPLFQRSPVVRGQWRGLGVDEGGDLVVHGGVGEPAFQPAAAVWVPGQAQFVAGARIAVVGAGAVLVEQVEQLGTPVAQHGRGVVVDLRGELLLHALPRLGVQSARGRPTHQPGDDLDVPQAGRAGGERVGGGGQLRGQHLPLQIDPGDHLLGRNDDPPRLDVLDPEQVGQRGHRPLPELSEHPPPPQRGDRVDSDLLRGPLDRGPDSQQLDHSSIIAGFGRIKFDSRKLAKDIPQEPVESTTIYHALILLEHTFDTQASTKIL